MSGMSIVDGNIGLGALFKRPEIGDGSLTIKGGLVAMGEVQFGVNGAIGLMNGGLLEYEYAAPRTIDIISQRDIRLTGGDVNALRARKRFVWGKSVLVRLDLGGRRIIKKKKK